jgi:recombinational DNA repair protein RecT
MAIKTVIKRGLKYVPKTPELARALEVDDRREIGQEVKDLFAGDLPETLPGEAPALDVGPQGSAERAAAALGAGTPPKAPVQDDIPFETKAEEDARVARETLQRAQKNAEREPGSDG